MHKIYKTFCGGSLLFAGLTGAGSASAQLTPGNIVVFQAHDGTTAITTTATGAAVFLKEFTRNTASQASPVTTITVPTTGAMRFVIAGNASTEGSLSLSADSTKLVFAGYDTSLANTVSLSGTTAANVRRVVDTVGSSGVAGRADTSATAFGNTNFRGAVKGMGENYWGVGGNSGVLYLGNAAAPASLGTTSTNLRLIQTFNGNLYYAAAGAVYKIAGMPTAAPTSPASLITVPSGSIYGFAINATETIAYIADDRGAAAGGGIQKWVNTGGTWTAVDTLFVGSGARGLAVDWSGTYPVLFTTTTATTANALVQVTDSGYSPSYNNTYITLATAPANTAFRGVAFTPKAAFSCTAPTLAAVVSNKTCTVNGSITLTTTGGSTVATYAWAGPGGFTAATQNISNLTPGVYSVTVTTVGGCTATLTDTVKNNASLTAAITALGPTTFCQGDSVTLRANTGSGFAYQWLSGNTPLPGATDSTYKVRSTGSYRVRISVGSCADTAVAIAITVTPRATANISATSDTTFCQGDSVVLTSVAGTGLSYKWLRNNSPIGGATLASYAANSTGNYRVMITNSGGCSDTSRAVKVTVKPAPVPVIAFVGGVLTLQNAAGYTNFRWYLNGAGLPIAGATGSAYTPVANGSYVLRADSNGCPGVSNAITVTGMSVSTATASLFRLYPNPAQNAFEMAPVGQYRVRLTDLQGREVLHTTTTSRVDISALADGLYLLHVRTEGGEEAAPIKLLKGK